MSDFSDPAAASAAVLNFEDETYRARFMVVTPSVAARWLKKNVLNRKLKTRMIERFKRSMTDGRWIITGETIAFDTAGNLTNGQNRLTACVESGASFPTLVVWGVSKDAIYKTDQVSPRTGADALTINGHKYGNILAAAASWVAKYSERRMMTAAGIDPDEAVTIVGQNPELSAAANFGSNVAQRLGFPSPLAFLYFAFHKADPVQALEFFDRLDKGDCLEQGDPILTLREWLLRQRMVKQQATGSGRASMANSEYMIAISIRAFNAWLAGESIQRLVWHTQSATSETFPEITGFPPKTSRKPIPRVSPTEDFAAKAMLPKRNNASREYVNGRS